MLSSCSSLRSLPPTALCGLALVAVLAGCDSAPPITMPAGFETARPGTTFKDLRATRTKARLVRKGGDVYLTEQSAPPRFRDAQIWLHFQEKGEAPADDLLRVERVILSTLDEQGVTIGAHEAGKASEESLQGMRKTIGDRFEQMRKATETSFGKPTSCATALLDCEWNFSTYQVRLHTVDALGPAKQRVPMGVRYVIRTPTAPDSPQPAPVFETAIELKNPQEAPAVPVPPTSPPDVAPGAGAATGVAGPAAPPAPAPEAPAAAAGGSAG